MRRRFVAVLAVAVSLPAFGQETREAETARYMDLAGIFADIARTVDRAAQKPNEKILVAWMIDNTSGLKNTRHGELLGDNLAKAFDGQKPGVHHAVLSFSETPQLVLKATADPRSAGEAIKFLAEQPADDKIKNCLENIRQGARYAAGFSGKKFLVVYTAENGDNEDNVEATLKMLRDTGVVLIVLAPEAMYSDPYWEALISGSGRLYYGDANLYKKLKFQMKGPESAYIEFPYGWLLTTGDPTYTVPSGHGFWALSRLTTHSGGRYFTYSPDASSTSFCQRWGCTVCGGQHKSCGGTFDVTKLKMTAPSIQSRDEARSAMAKDKLQHAVYGSWDRLFRAGLMSYGPPLKSSGGSLSERKTQYQSNYPLAFGAAWASGRATSQRLAAETDKVIAEVEEALKTLGPDASIRSMATAEALLVHLKLLRINLLQLALFCDEMEEHERGKHQPDTGFGGDGLEDACGHRFTGWTYRSIWLCHGGAPLKGVKMLGGEKERKEIDTVLDQADALIEKHRGTPFEVLVRRGSLAVYKPAGGT